MGRWKAFEEAAAVSLPPKKDDKGNEFTCEQRIVKSIQEIVNTEREFVKVSTKQFSFNSSSHCHVQMLDILVVRYLEPLQMESFLPREQMSVLCTRLMNVIVEQKQFKGRIEVLQSFQSIWLL